jgi:hypothetical protein
MNTRALSGRSVIAFAFAVACASAVPAPAAEVIVLDRTLPPEVRVVGTNFEVDETLGSVRLAVDFFDDAWEGSLTTELVEVPGLTFDREHRQVRYESEGSSVTCAERRKFLWNTSYPATSACRIIVRTEPRVAHTGFRESRLNGWIVELATNLPTKAAARTR